MRTSSTSSTFCRVVSSDSAMHVISAVCRRPVCAAPWLGGLLAAQPKGLERNKGVDLLTAHILLRLVLDVMAGS